MITRHSRGAVEQLNPSVQVFLCGALGFCVTCLLVAGCSSVAAPGARAQIAQRAAAAEAAAQNAQAAGETFQALEQWLIVDVLQPDHAQARARITALRQELGTQAEQLLTEADAAVRKRRYKTAHRLLLRALAAQPGNTTIRQRLARLELGRQQRLLARSASRRKSADPAAEVLAATAVPLNPQLQRAELLYQQAIDRLDTDVVAAKQLFEEVLDIAPTHLGARAYLDSLP